MHKRFCVILFLLFTAFALASAQTTRVRGQVTDAATGEPIPFVAIYFDGTTIGISTDLNGRYSLETRSSEAKVLTAQIIGYESQSASVNKGSFSEINFALKEDARQLSAALVKPDDRYIKSILRKLDQSRAKNDPDNAPDWHSRLYSKIELDITSMEDLMSIGFIGRNLEFLNDYADTSAITGKAYVPALISENVSDLYHSNDPEFHREVMRASHISGIEEDNFLRQFTGSYLLKTNFYKSGISVINLDIPNPAASSSRIFYNYFLVDSLQVEGRKTYVLRFHPKKLVTSPTLDGEMQLDAEDFGIRSVHASLSAASNVNWVRHVNIDIENRRLPNGQWFYGDEKLFIDFSISVNDDSRILSFLGHRQISYGEPDFGPITDPDALSSTDAVVMRNVTSGDPLYWEAARPYPLTEREAGINRMVEDFQETSFYKWNYALARTLIGGYYEVKPWKVEFGRYARTIVHNDVEGLRLMVGGRTLKEFSKTLRLGGYFAYGFKDQEPKWEASAEIMFRREKTRKLTLKYRKDFEQLGSGTGVFSAQNMFSSIFARSHANMQSMVESIDALYEHEFHPSVNADLRWTSSRLWSNPAVPFISTQDNQLWDHFDVHELRTSWRFSFAERVNRNYFKKTYLYTKYPIITLEMAGAFKGITQNDFAFLRPHAGVYWATPSSAFGFGRMWVEAGMIIGSVPYPLLKLHEGNQTFFVDRSAFSCMDYYEFISDRWVSGYYEHNFNGFLLGKIPLIKKLDLREVATVRFAWGTLTQDNRQNGPFLLPPSWSGETLDKEPYLEVGAGISNIFRILRVDAFWRLTHRRPDAKKNFTVNVGIDIDF